jgi:hypothetical protein
MKIAEYATEAGIRPAAHLFALFGTVAAVGGLLTSVSAFIQFRSVLRQAESD